MATIHLMYGFIGCGKSTIAKKLAKDLPAIWLCVDDFNFKLFGRNPYGDGFEKYVHLNKDLIWDITKETINNGISVIIDSGGISTKQMRQDYYKKARAITDDVVYNIIECDINTAKERALKRTRDNEQTLEINEDDIKRALNRFEEMSDDEAYGYNIVLHDNN